MEKMKFFAKIFIKNALTHLKLSNFTATKWTAKKNSEWAKNIRNNVKTRLLLWSKMTQNWKNETFCNFFRQKCFVSLQSLQFPNSLKNDQVKTRAGPKYLELGKNEILLWSKMTQNVKNEIFCNFHQKCFDSPQTF